MRIRKLIFIFALMLFSSFSYASDSYFIDQTNGALTSCRADIDETNQYYCSLTLYTFYETVSSPQPAYVLGYFSLKDSSGTVVNNYYFGTSSSTPTPDNDCPDIADMGFYTTYNYPKCSGTPPSYICPASTHWQFSNNQCVYSSNDTDHDEVLDDVDNCPTVANAEQLDSDSDGVGDACEASPDPDADGDGVPDLSDNCPNDANSDQANSDGDVFGDVCDPTPYPDADADGVQDSADNCPNAANPSQSDVDVDGVGDACDTCNPGDYSNHQEFASDFVSPSTPVSYCNSQNCTMTKTGQSCDSGVCYVDYFSNGDSCSEDTTPTDWSQYFQQSAESQGYNLALDNSNFTLESGITSYMNGSGASAFTFKVINCVRSSLYNNVNYSWAASTSGSSMVSCVGFPSLDICLSPQQIDSNVQEYVRQNPFVTSTFPTDTGSFYIVGSNSQLIAGSYTGIGSGTPDTNLGSDDGSGTYAVTLLSHLDFKGDNASFDGQGYTFQQDYKVGYPLKLTLQGCASGTGGTDGNSGTGSDFNSINESLFPEMSVCVENDPSIHCAKPVEESFNNVKTAFDSSPMKTKLSDAESKLKELLGAGSVDSDNDGIGDSFQCQPIEFNITYLTDEPIIMDSHCTIANQVKPFVNAVSTVAWGLFGIFVFLGG